ncbi:vacuolar atpase assembly integral membrane vma21 protein [Rutstroemia sp. NJR-2017a WRK4]|nr:vacuolar atpase assembly integral membrane vma21 protein [Rutstroemia sp. NJR-2017a BBW]PQE27091.1 vacuolar atpase assembly integral membrane vma21 protein [Rutstroemia sp. NJR-2017a WRK4]
MATRRNVSSNLTSGEEKEKEFKPVKGEKSNIAPAVPAHVIYKLLGFTFAMIVVPIGSYFVTLDTLFKGNSTYAGALAAVMANVVLIGYVVVAMNEDQSEAIEAAEKDSKKDL